MMGFSRILNSLIVVQIICIFFILLDKYGIDTNVVYPLYTSTYSDSEQMFPSHRTLKLSYRFRDNFKADTITPFSIGQENVTNKDKYLIYRCDKSTLYPCGSWADRIYGSITAYTIANLTGRTFKMEMFHGSCDFQNLIVPNEVNWRFTESFHTNVEKDRETTIWNMTNKQETFFMNASEDFMSVAEMAYKYVYLLANNDNTLRLKSSTRYRKQLSWMSNLTQAEINTVIYQRLFKPSPYLLQRVKLFLKENLPTTESLVCAHLRTLRNPAIPKDDGRKIVYPMRNIYKVWRFILNQRNDLDCKVFLSSDSENIFVDAKKRKFAQQLFLSPGKNTLHFDQSLDSLDAAMCKGLEKVLFEQLVLLHCDVLLINASGFSLLTAYIRGVDKGLYCLLDNGEIVPCKRDELRELYGKHL